MQEGNIRARQTNRTEIAQGQTDIAADLTRQTGHGDEQLRDSTQIVPSTGRPAKETDVSIGWKY